MPQSQPQPVLEAEELKFDYRPCGCAGVIANRACRHCFNARWLKRCDDCKGEGTLEKAPRQRMSPARVERCGRCMGTGWTPCPLKDIPAAEALEQELIALEKQQLTETEIPPPAPRRRGYVPVKHKKKPGPKPKAKLSTARAQNPVEAKEQLEAAAPEDPPPSAA